MCSSDLRIQDRHGRDFVVQPTSEEVVTDVARFDVQRLAEAFLSGDTARYARVLEGLRGEGEAPTLLLWALAEELRALGRIVAGTAAGRPMDQLFRENRVWRNKEAAVRAAVADQRLIAPQGEVRIDPQTYHAWLTPRIGRSTAAGQFEVLLEAPEPITATRRSPTWKKYM